MEFIFERKTMEHTTNADVIAVASSYISYANTLLVFGALIIAAVTIGLMIYYGQNKEKLIKETATHILEKISQDEQIRAEFIQKILSNENFKQEFETMIDIHLQDKMDDIRDGMQNENEQKQNRVGELK